MVVGGTSLATLAVTFTLLWISSTMAVGATYYRWTDDNGNRVHSDRPPSEGVGYEVVSTDSSQVRPVQAETGAVPKGVVPLEGGTYESPEPLKLTTIKNPEYCTRARQNLEVIDVAPRIRTRDDEGEMRILTPQERSIERQKALDAIDAYCE